MTERKTTEIKIRVTPSFKARVQGAADAAGVSLTEWLETSAQERIWADEIRSFDSLNPLNALVVLEKSRWSPETHPTKSWMYEGKGG